MPRQCSFEGCDRPHECHGLCHGHNAQRKAGKTLHPIRERRKPGGPSVMGKITCCRCYKLAEKMRNGAYYCRRHYRIKQMRDDAAVDRKIVPSREELERMFDEAESAGMTCAVCGRQMNMVKDEGKSTLITLQHDRDGGVRLICLGCNVKHQFHPGDSFYEVPLDKRRCTLCGEIKSLQEFYKNSSSCTGLRSECIPCSKQEAVRWSRKTRRARAEAEA